MIFNTYKNINIILPFGCSSIIMRSSGGLVTRWGGGGEREKETIEMLLISYIDDSVRINHFVRLGEILTQTHLIFLYEFKYIY